MPQKKLPFAATAAAVATALLLVACGGDNPEALLASAKDYIAKNDHKAAVIQVKNVLQKQPDSPEARFLLGSSLLASGDVTAAEIELYKARALKYPDEQVVPKLAQALLAQGKSKKVIEEFANTKLSAPAAVAELQTALASAYAIERNGPASQAALKAALAADPNNVTATLMQIRGKLATGDADGGAAQLDALIAREDKSAEAWQLKGDLLQFRNKPDEALAAYRKAVQVRPTFAQGHVGAVNVLLRQGKMDEVDKEMEALKKLAPNHPETRYLETQIAFTKKDLPKARELVQQLLKMAPNNPRGLEIAGGIELQRNAFVAAEEHLAKAVQAAPGLPLARRWLALTYLRTGQAGKALTTLAPMLDGAAADPALLTLAGEAHLMNGDPKKAEDYFARASKLDPSDARKRTALAVTQMAAGGQIEAGLETLQSIAASDTGTSADMALISTYLRRNELDKALKAIDELQKKAPTNPVAGQLRGRVLLSQKDEAGARKSFEGVLAIDPNYFPAITSLASMDVAAQKPEEARKRFEGLLSREPKNGRAMIALAELRARDSGDHTTEVIDLLKRAVAADPTDAGPRVLLIDYLLRQQNAKQAVTEAQAGVAAMGDNPQLLDAAGRALLASGDTNQGLTTLAKAASLQPQAAAPMLRLADAQLGAKNPSAAEQSLRKALDLQPDYLDAQGRLMGLRLEQGKLDEAVAIAKTVQKQRPTAAVGYLMEGDARLTKQDINGALSAYQAGLKVAPAPDLVVRMHATLAKAGRTAEADRQIADWTQRQPKDVAVPMYLADAALNVKKMAEAEKHYLNVVKLQPDNAVAYNNLAWVTSELKKDGAIAYAEKANTLAPNQPAFIDTLAMLLADKQDFKRAIELQTRVLQLQGTNPLFKLNMARIYAKAGEKDNARKQLDELTKLGDKFAGQAEVEKLRATL